MGYTVVHVDDVDPAGPGGAVRFVRRELGAQVAIGARRGSYEPRGPF